MPFNKQNPRERERERERERLYQGMAATVTASEQRLGALRGCTGGEGTHRVESERQKERERERERERENFFFRISVVPVFMCMYVYRSIVEP